MLDGFFDSDSFSAIDKNKLTPEQLEMLKIQEEFGFGNSIGTSTLVQHLLEKRSTARYSRGLITLLNLYLKLSTYDRTLPHIVTDAETTQVVTNFEGNSITLDVIPEFEDDIVPFNESLFVNGAILISFAKCNFEIEVPDHVNQFAIVNLAADGKLTFQSYYRTADNEIVGIETRTNSILGTSVVVESVEGVEKIKCSRPYYPPVTGGSGLPNHYSPPVYGRSSLPNTPRIPAMSPPSRNTTPPTRQTAPRPVKPAKSSRSSDVKTYPFNSNLLK